MAPRRDPVSPEDKKRALAMLAAGKVSLPELAEVMGVSTHMLWNWCRIAKIDWRRVRRGVVLRLWNRGGD